MSRAIDSIFRSFHICCRLSRRTMTTRSYREAIDTLNSLQSNAAALDLVRATGGRSSAFAIPEMIEYLGIIGYKPADLNALNVIHITGTKGKGSTSAFTDSILREAHPEWTIGLYTSPHLIAVRERIRVNGKPLSEEDFSRFFFEVWDKIETNKVRSSLRLETTPDKPGYFRFLTLVAYHAFLSLKVDATILEVGVGGAHDSTNIVPRPIVTGITALGIDHVNVLGKTLAEIAWQKGGIFKQGVPALTVSQPPEGLEVLKQQATDLKASEFKVVSSIPQLSEIELAHVLPGLAGKHQQQNATLAVHLAQTFLRAQEGSLSDTDVLPPVIVRGLEKARWPGRCQTVEDPVYTNTTWYLDGAHTLESLECCVQWFASPGVGLRSEIGKPQRRILIFNCTSGRSGASFLDAIHSHIKSQLQIFGSDETPSLFFDHVVFCTNVTYVDGGFKGDLTSLAIPESDLTHLKTQHQLSAAWSELIPTFPAENVHVLPSIQHAVNLIRQFDKSDGDHTAVLVTGSLHLVGGVIEVADLSFSL
ncbi:Folylpolyglutamate synthase [Mycena indigotica]|uniref:Folylpolyglutamate synthase n=1 Tax=Mycena indigotica TaxID=2126181 RepID=A0A8H6SLV8_9AGAR|nr:Folylpolyglutamate synthase [Mycena indigotica]KAF7301806.1 Folylpolyglutamate synthase [Mycena indigotica]